MAEANPPSQTQRCDLLITNAYVITVDKQRRIFSPGAVAIRDHNLCAVGPERDVVDLVTAGEVIDAGGAPLHPGFIDAHNHIVGGGCRGVLAEGYRDPASGVNYADWKAEVSADDERIATELGALQLLHNGFTGFVEPGTVFDPDAVAAAAHTVGIRASLSAPYLWDAVEVMRNLGALESRALLERAPASLERALDLLGSQLHRNADPDGLLHGFVCLYGLGTASDELERAAKALADEHDVMLHQHEAYEPSTANAERERLGHSRIVHLAELGILGRNSTLVHMSMLDDADAVLLEESGCSVVWCPIPYLNFGLAAVTPCRMPELDRRGVNVALASDSARDCTMGDEALAAHLVAMNAGERLAPESILEMQTINAATAAGLDAITGSLEPGKRADLVVRKRDSAEAYPGVNPIHQLALTCRAGTADTVVVNGAVVLRDGRSTRVDEHAVCQRAQTSIRERMARLGIGQSSRWKVAS